MPSPPHRRPKHAALYVRLPLAEAAKLDLAAFELKAAKQDLVAGLVARYVDPASAAGLAALRDLAGEAREAKQESDRPFGFAANRRRVVVETQDDALTVGRHGFRAAEQPEVLTAKQAAALLQVEEATVAGLAETGELPGRLIEGEWRFARRAVLGWLADGQET